MNINIFFMVAIVIINSAIYIATSYLANLAAAGFCAGLLCAMIINEVSGR